MSNACGKGILSIDRNRKILEEPQSENLKRLASRRETRNLILTQIPILGVAST